MHNSANGAPEHERNKLQHSPNKNTDTQTERLKDQNEVGFYQVIKGDSNFNLVFLI